MPTNLDQLSDIQRKIYDLLGEGKSTAVIATKLGTTEALVKANITRIQTKNIPLPKAGTPVATPPPNTVPVSNILSQPSPPPAATGGSENERIAAYIGKDGKALSADELAALADKVAGRAVRDVHPMMLLGITIQFVKFCGGRMVAHQVIEDVYGALRAFAGDTTKDEGGEASPLPQSDKDRLTFLEEQNVKLLDELRDLQAKVRSQNPSLINSN